MAVSKRPDFSKGNTIFKRSICSSILCYVSSGCKIFGQKFLLVAFGLVLRKSRPGRHETSISLMVRWKGILCRPLGGFANGADFEENIWRFLQNNPCGEEKRKKTQRPNWLAFWDDRRSFCWHYIESNSKNVPENALKLACVPMKKDLEYGTPIQNPILATRVPHSPIIPHKRICMKMSFHVKHEHLKSATKYVKEG